MIHCYILGPTSLLLKPLSKTNTPQYFLFRLAQRSCQFTSGPISAPSLPPFSLHLSPEHALLAGEPGFFCEAFFMSRGAEMSCVDEKPSPRGMAASDPGLRHTSSFQREREVNPLGAQRFQRGPDNTLTSLKRPFPLHRVAAVSPF